MSDYSDYQFGRELQEQLDAGYDPTRIGSWAFFVMSMDPEKQDRSKAVEDCLHELAMMEEGSEFHIPEPKLRALALRFVTSADR